MKNIAVGGLGFVITIYTHSFVTRGHVAIREWPCGGLNFWLIGFVYKIRLSEACHFQRLAMIS